MDKIRKRDGRIVPFDQNKITEAIFKAAKSVGGENHELAQKLSGEVAKLLDSKFRNKIPSVEDIQDVVEKVLIETGHAKTAKAYILYRQSHEELRDIKALFDSIEVVENYITQSDWRVNENSNMNFSLQGLNNYISSRIIASYWLHRLYGEDIRKAHMDGEFHIHDLGTLGPYCVGWDLKGLLIHGFGGVRGKVESKPPKHFRAALGQVVNFFYTLQGEAAGAQAFSNFDTYLAPFIRYDNLSYKEVKQAMQEFIFNMNVPTRVGFQTPFTNVTLDLKVPKFMAKEPVICGGTVTKEHYGSFQEEMDMFNKAFAEVMMEGDAKARVFTFPIPTYNITSDFDWENPLYEPIWEMTAKYGIPYFSNFINSDMKPEDARSMCCRLRIDNRELHKRGGGLFGANPLTGSIGVVTINLARIGYQAKTKEEFKEKLQKLMDLSKTSLETKRKFLERFTEHGLYPYSKYYLQDVKAMYGCFWKNHFSTIGINGMNEALINFMGVNIASEEGREFAKEILGFMRDVLAKYQEETGDIFNLEATPAEGCTYRFAKKDKEIYPQIVAANESAVQNKKAAPYYTNSTHLPVNYTDDIFEALTLQDELQCMYTGGTVLHGFLGQRVDSTKTVRALVKRIAERFKLPYFTLCPTFSICEKHGYLQGEHEFCPKCDEEIGYVEAALEVK